MKQNTEIIFSKEEPVEKMKEGKCSTAVRSSDTSADVKAAIYTLRRHSGQTFKCHNDGIVLSLISCAEGYITLIPEKSTI